MRKLAGILEATVRLAMAAIFIFTALIPSPALAEVLAGKLSRHLGSQGVHAATTETRTSGAQPLISANYPPYSGQTPSLASPDIPLLKPLPPGKIRQSIEFNLEARPAVVAFGDLVTMRASITNNTDTPIFNLAFSDALEQGYEFDAEQSAEVEFQQGASVVSASIPVLAPGQSITVSYVVRITGTKNPNRSNGELWIHHAELRPGGTGPRILAKTQLWVGRNIIGDDYALGTVPAEGGWVSIGDLSIYFDPDAVPRDALVMFRPTYATATGPANQFQLDVIGISPLSREPQSGLREQKVAVSSEYFGEFEGPVFLEVPFDAVGNLTNIPAGKIPYIATFDEENQIWVKVPISVIDRENNTLTVQAAHFSVWGSGLGDAVPQNGANVLLFDQPYTSLFTGSARYGVPIWTPPARGGMGPGLTLSYSSATLDGVLGDVQAPWVGVGWNLDEIEIVRKITTDSSSYGYENEFALTLNGEVHQLIQDANWAFPKKWSEKMSENPVG